MKMDQNDEPVDTDISLAKNRSRREKTDRSGRKAALERFRESRTGQRPKFALADEKNIYDEVDETEYSRIVRDRQDDDWIIDDGTGYVEDGREIFDEDPDEVVNNAKNTKNKASASRSKPSKDPNIRPTDSKPTGIRSMFAAVAAKPKVQKTVSLDDDDILGDIMGELKRGEEETFRPVPVRLIKQPAHGGGGLVGMSKMDYGSSPYGSAFRSPSCVGQQTPTRLEASASRMDYSSSSAYGSSGFRGNSTIQQASRPEPYTAPAMASRPAVKETMQVKQQAMQPLVPSKIENNANSRTNGSHMIHKSVVVSSVKAGTSAAGKQKSCDDESVVGQISQVASQDVDNVHQSQLIEEFDEEMEQDMALCGDVDVSGIDFSDNFEQEIVPVNNNNNNNKIQKVSDFPKKPLLSNQNTAVKEVKSSVWTSENEPSADISIDSTHLPMTTVNGEEVLRMFWLDAFEDHIHQPGVVYLFGKVYAETASAHVSCCLTVRNVERRVFLLPRRYRRDWKTGVEDQSQPVTFIDVYQEFNEKISEKYKIMTFKSMKVTRQYAFDKPDVPAESEYLEVRYSAEFPVLPVDLSGETFSCVFGTNTSALESFLLDRKIKGPSWLDVSSPQVSIQSISWCRLEAFVSKPDLVKLSDSPRAPPPLVVMTIAVRTSPQPKNQQNEIVSIACLVHNSFPLDRGAPKPVFQSHFCTVAPPTNCVFPFDFRDRVSGKTGGNHVTMKIETIASERGLLGFLLAKLHKIDPDVIVGHDIAVYDFDVLLHRINANKVPHWSKLGRLKRANLPKFGARYGASSPAAGRLVLDTMISAKELIRCRSYDLTELVSHVLKEHRQVYEPEQIRSSFNSSQSLLALLESTLLDATYSMRIASDLSALPLAAQITNICGNVMSRTLAGGRSERNEYLLLHAFAERNFIVPDKIYGKRPIHTTEDLDDEEEMDATMSKKAKSARKKPAYTGGLVLEPKRGFYDKYILLVDFNSLYPSIIQEYNICFTTVATGNKSGKTDDDEDYDDSLIPESGLEPGVLPTEIRRLVESRRQVRQLMKSPGVSSDQMAQYDIRQRALKLTANSLYGCLGFTHSRFYARRLAALVTGKGREILLKTKDLVQGMNLYVIYGDTDSLMIATGSLDIDEVYKLGNRIKAEVNKLYRHLEIDIDGVFRSMLLLKKKKYAALTVQKVGDTLVTTQEMKGLDMVRRDWCTLAKDTGTFVVSQILSGKTRENVVEAIHTRLLEIGNAVRNREIPLEAFQITKQLTKNPEDYPDRKSLPHVQVAMRLNSAAGSRRLHGGDTVVYVVCEDGSNLPATQRAYHPDLEVAKRSDLQIDCKYYLEQQVHPVVARLCDPIEGTDAARIAECLGLDSGNFRQAMRRDEDEDEALLAAVEESDGEKYRDCERFTFPCHSCGAVNNVGGVLKENEKTVLLLEKCPGCDVCPLDNLAYVRNRLAVALRRQIHRYYEGWQVCEDTACAARARRTPLVLNHGQPVCTICRRGILRPEFSDRALYLQLGFYRHVFDLEKAVSPDLRNSISDSLKTSLTQLKIDVDHVLKNSAYSEVNLSRLFEGLCPFPSR